MYLDASVEGIWEFITKPKIITNITFRMYITIFHTVQKVLPYP